MNQSENLRIILPANKREELERRLEEDKAEERSGSQYHPTYSKYKVEILERLLERGEITQEELHIQLRVEPFTLYEILFKYAWRTISNYCD